MPPQPVQTLQTQTKLGSQQQQLQNQLNSPQTIVSNNQISKCVLLCLAKKIERKQFVTSIRIPSPRNPYNTIVKRLALIK